MATNSVFSKVTRYGDYTDPKQNHKDSARNTEQYHLVHCRINNGRKHSGSKNIHTLRMYR